MDAAHIRRSQSRSRQKLIVLSDTRRKEKEQARRVPFPTTWPISAASLEGDRAATVRHQNTVHRTSSLALGLFDMTNGAIPDCNSSSWLFVFATGRSGSTTLLSMLNEVPQIRLSGENGNLLSMIETAEAYTRNDIKRNAARWPQSWYNAPDMQLIDNDICSWIGHLLGEPRAHVGLHDSRQSIADGTTGGASSGLPVYFGFKAIKVEMLPVVLRLFPRAQIVVNYRHELHQQANSSWWRRVNGSEAFLADKTQNMLLEVEKSGHRFYQMPLETFSAASFTKLLRWLGIQGCSYDSVLHWKIGKTLEPSNDTRVLSGKCFRASL